MTGWVPWLAQITGLGGGELVPPTASKATTLLANDAALVVLAGLCLTLLFAPWAVRIWRKSGRRQRRYKRVAAAAAPGGTNSSLPLAPPTPLPPESSAARSSRRRVRANRPRNPTLAEVGGLPPLRPDPPSPSASN